MKRDYPIGIEDERRSRESIRLGDGRHVDFITSSVLSGCTLDVRGTGLTIMGSTLDDCTFKVKRLTNVQFCAVRFVRCRFIGTFVGCEFGDDPQHRPENSSVTRSHPAEPGTVEDCDLRGTVFDRCSFWRCEPTRVHWPDWPNIAVIDSPTARKRWSALELPYEMRVTQSTLATHERYGEFPSVSTIHLPRNGVDPELVWPIIQDEEYIVFPGKENKPRANRGEVEQALRAIRDDAAHKEHLQSIKAEFANLAPGRILSVRRQASEGALAVEPYGLLKKVPNAPSHVVVRISASEAIVFRDEDGKPITDDEIVGFEFRSADARPGNVLLKPRRRRASAVIINCEAWSIEDADGRPVADELLRAWTDYLDRRSGY